MTRSRQTPQHGLPIPVEMQWRLRALVQRLGGTHHVARRLGVGEPAISRALAGIGVRTATATAIRLGLDALDDEQTEPTAA